MLFLDASPVYARIVERMRWLPEQDEEVPQPGDLPSREQRLLLMRLASLFGPDAIAQAPRAARFATDGDVRVVVGLQALTRAVAEIDRLPEQARTPGVATSYDEVTQIVNPTANPESVARRIRGTTWKLTDRSESGCRLLAPAKDAPAQAGRTHRDQGRRPVDAGGRAADAAAAGRRGDRRRRDHRAAPRARADAQLGDAVAMPARTRADRPFFGIYLPAHPENRQAAQRSLIGPDDKFIAGRHGRARHRQRALPHPLHADAGAAGGLVVGAVQRGAQAFGLSAGASAVVHYVRSARSRGREYPLESSR